MSDTAQNISHPPAADDGRPVRRALVVADGAHAPLDEGLAAAGYEVMGATSDDAPRSAGDAEPDVVLIVLGETDDEQSDTVALARRLRADARTFALPLVLLHRRDADALRLAALGVGADDYFALATPAAEIRARLDSLLWRAEAGRLAALPVEGQSVGRSGSGVQSKVENVSRGGGDEEHRAAAAHDASPNVPAEPFGGGDTDRANLEAGAATTSPSSPPSDPAHAETRSPSSSDRQEPRDVGRAPAFSEGDDARSGDDTRRADNVRTQERRETASTPATREARMMEALGAATDSLSRAGRGVAARGPSTGGARAAGRGGPRRLLLAVSDAARMAQLNLLIRSANYEVRAAFDGQQALSLLRIERPDLVLVDFELHDMDGVEMLRRLREQQGGRHAPPPAVLLLDARNEQARREATEIGARAVVTLPYNSDELLESIHTAGSAD